MYNIDNWAELTHFLNYFYCYVWICLQDEFVFDLVLLSKMEIYPWIVSREN